MRQLVVDGIVLKRKNVGEADRFVTLFTKQFGKMQLKAIGVRKIASRRASHIELLNVVRCGVYKGKGMPILTEIATQESFSGIKTDLNKVGFAYHICELIDGLCPENQENPAIFTLLENVFAKIQREESLSIIIHDFEITLLTLLGYWSPQQSAQKQQTAFLIENILERRLKTRQILPKLLS
jgi:DNA repair protein RecO (recombination protein O)